MFIQMAFQWSGEFMAAVAIRVKRGNMEKSLKATGLFS